MNYNLIIILLIAL